MIEAEVDPTMREWMFAREMLRQLGFASDELFMAVHQTGKILEGGRCHDLNNPVLFLRVEAQGKQWTWTIGPTDLPPDQIRDHFETAAALWNAGGFAREGLERSAVFAQKVALVHALHSKGFRFGTANATEERIDGK